MILDSVKARVLASVADGLTVAEAAHAHGLNSNQGRSAISVMCRRLGISSEIKEIRANPKKYRELATSIVDRPRYDLRSDLRIRLRSALHLHSEDQLTPEYLSGLTPARLLDAGISEHSLGEIQAWLLANETSLKRRPPGRPEHATMVKRAAYLLDSFGFEMTGIKDQLRNT